MAGSGDIRLFMVHILNFHFILVFQIPKTLSGHSKCSHVNDISQKTPACMKTSCIVCSKYQTNAYLRGREVGAGLGNQTSLSKYHVSDMVWALPSIRRPPSANAPIDFSSATLDPRTPAGLCVIQIVPRTPEVHNTYTLKNKRRTLCSLQQNTSRRSAFTAQ